MTTLPTIIAELEEAERAATPGIEFVAQIPGYGRFRFMAADREQAEAMANTKRQWEAAPNCIVWRSDLATKFDQLTERLADIWLDGAGAPRKLMVRRAKARAALQKEKSDV